MRKVHIVILQNDSEIKVVTFDGPAAETQAHDFATQSAMTGKWLVTVAQRVRQCGCYRNFKDAFV